ncbi:ribbon-helix-helix protein, CopG family [Proteocatella sphenisci]|nr:ribbon-helix-helix protein, CopG family [Proteocatella sphenisci]
MEKIDVSINEAAFNLIEEKAIREQKSISAVCREVIEEYYKNIGREHKDD